MFLLNSQLLQTLQQPRAATQFRAFGNNFGAKAVLPTISKRIWTTPTTEAMAQAPNIQLICGTGSADRQTVLREMGVNFEVMSVLMCPVLHAKLALIWVTRQKTRY